jgi:hypothetical protein
MGCISLLVGLGLFIQLIHANNYGKQALSISYDTTGLPIFGTLNGTVTELDTISPTIILNRTDAALNCSSGFMNIRLVFKQPFFGIVYSDFDRNSACKLTGNGKKIETIQLPLTGCGTFQSPARVFTNNIVVRFHPGLEIDGDEVITVICRYPPPIVPPPLIPESLKIPPSESVGIIQPLREFEILLIICAIIFLALLLLGIGCSYYCLKKRNIKVVRRRPTSTLGSDITKISEPVSMFDGLKIPRAHAIDASGSEDLTESITTDFPSDIASLESEEEYTSAYSDKMCILSEGIVISTLREAPMPAFDIIMTAKDSESRFTPVPSTASSESETVLNAQEQYLTTILERTETNTLETLERYRKATEKKGPPPVHARLNIKNRLLSETSGTDVDSASEYSKDGTEFSEQEMELEARQMKNYSLVQEFSHKLKEDDAFYYTDTSFNAKNKTKTVFSQMKAEAVPSNFDVLIRIVNNYELYENEDASSIFTEEERLAIKQVLEDDSYLCSKLKKTFSREEIFVMQQNHFIQTKVEPRKWDVLIRILNTPRCSLDENVSESSAVPYDDDETTRTEAGLASFETRSVAASGVSSQWQDSLSAADRSGTEITEYHHFRTNKVFQWKE